MAMPSTSTRRLPIGAEPVADGVHFRVFAPKRRSVEVVFDGDTPAAARLVPEADGYFAGVAAGARVGGRYKFRLDGEAYLYPDPVSRYQPEGPHGWSQVVDPAPFKWTDAQWKGTTAAGQVLYEFHVGTFTPEGTWRSAIDHLDHLRDLGVTCIEMMPVPEFAGSFGWGYDGVAIFAPYHHYGTPDDLRAFVDAAHARGIGVILDLVYNHMGPDGNYLRAFADEYFNKHHMTDWGEALNFDGDHKGPCREFFVSNALMWVTEFHFDGFRFDATQAIIDGSPEHVLAEINRTCRAAVPHRSLYLINENEPQNTQLVRPADRGGYGMDALWNDDFHHTAVVALTGHKEAYYTDYNGSPQELLSCTKWGYLYQGQRYKWQKRRRGTVALDLPPTVFVHFLQNHDQIANGYLGRRVHQLTSPAQFRTMTAFLLLMPQTPMLFQGQEFAADSPFHYFADHNPELNKLIAQGRSRELAQFPSGAVEPMRRNRIDPGARSTFDACKLDLADRDRPGHAEVFKLHQDLLRLRREDAVFARVQRRGDVDGAVLSDAAFVLRYFATPGPGTGAETASKDDRLVLVNLGNDLPMDPCPEPLLAPPPGHRWTIVLTTEDPIYGGTGTPPADTENEGWLLHGRCAIVLKPVREDGAVVQTRHVVQGSAQEVKKKE
jgi:maltooligosyltrehalose trehalohydrolase